ncbi:PIP5KL1 [Lepeophtheirus salmonis]|uniref:PIP5KL1 n=1 Tax=Lepeophtheirus salmonis TaxID=72036 RepID=A0A7R8H1Q9_LEPSM|nr:PIP5KL1 [Lepeophtheirus salmonis]CAF2811817.1 PIP5KL1 [Lepeophtheirus salmonis]
MDDQACWDREAYRLQDQKALNSLEIKPSSGRPAKLTPEDHVISCGCQDTAVIEDRPNVLGASSVVGQLEVNKPLPFELTMDPDRKAALLFHCVGPEVQQSRNILDIVPEGQKVSYTELLGGPLILGFQSCQERALVKLNGSVHQADGPSSVNTDVLFDQFSNLFDDARGQTVSPTKAVVHIHENNRSFESNAKYFATQGRSGLASCLSPSHAGLKRSSVEFWAIYIYRIRTMSSSSLSTEEDLGPNRSSNKVRKLWKNVQMRFLRYGLVEVDGDHPQYILLECIRLSLHQHLPKVLSSKLLNESHYSEVKIIDSKLQYLKHFRLAMESKKRTLSIQFPPSLPGFLTISTNPTLKGNIYFSLRMTKDTSSNLKRKRMFISLDHISKTEQSKPVHFIIMQSIFWPENGLNRRYDLKGCLAGRFEQVPSGVRRSEVVFKDKNFYGTGLRLGNQRSWFVEQLSRDVEFLQRLDIMDYSLLVGICKESEGAHGESLAELVSSIKRYLTMIINNSIVGLINETNNS